MLVVASASLAKAVIPTKVPLAAFSETEFKALLVSVIDEVSNSSTSAKLIVNSLLNVAPEASVTRTVIACEVAAS